MIEPKILKGTRDFGPAEMNKRLAVINTMRQIFSRFGYEPIETPAIEYAETILGKYGDEGDKLTYTFDDNGGRKIALRYDQTVPTARFVAMNWQNLALPFKRYQIGPVWRADKPQKGRYREFYQCDIDIIGSKSLLADAEIAKVVYEVFSALNVKGFVIRVNSRALLDQLLDQCGVKKEQRLGVIRLIDKLDKVSLAEVKTEIAELGIDKKTLTNLEKSLLSEKARNNLSALPEVEAKKDMNSFFNLTKKLGIPEANLQLDLTLARGLDYYTGIIFEVIVPNSGLGSLCGGGRYDNLTGLFSNQVFPGTGVAFGLDRLMVYLEDKKLLENAGNSSKVMLAYFPDTLEETYKTLQDLQEAGVNGEIYLEDAKLQKQFKYADKKQIPFVILLGSDEAKKGLLVLKDMKAGKQETMTIEEVIKKIR